ncbi:CBS domain-containing protein [Streptomyces turgidiscabies]|uniref:CBS domain protein n=1 Tax=Streptomyces turgidiscabies (strain Car8) TaxID=698760 RepID=L7F558_STRT8|nr:MULTISPECIES: CBS domain-containing protein [Streptomyces]ELP66442.1 CBS domain protein [Streptomyces turgidiscabies Car8]MDX3495229.1 CBS domain-containing protein [Streptomyces turgidiscabies]GAQ71105.1 inosine-5'-monophosphate dehydrogenase [Streptomyces turgidiscabies]
MHGTPHIVSDVMTSTVVALGGGAMFKDIVKTMQQWKVSALPVLDGEERVIGVVSEADLLPKEGFRDSDPDRYTQLHRLSDLIKAGAVTAQELMTAPAITVHPDATLARAARVMARSRVKRLPVVDGRGLLKGVVSRSDLLKVFLRDDEDIAGEVRRGVVDQLFPDPVEPIRVEVRDGVVTLTGRIRDTTLVPVAARLVRAVEGVVDVDFALAGPPRHPDLDPDLPDDAATRRTSGTGSAS